MASMATVIENQIPTKRSSSTQSEDGNPAKTKWVALGSEPAVLAASPGSDEPQGCAIFQHLHTLEVESKRRLPLSGYMEKVQEEISPVMRTILVDWLVDVAQEYTLASDTLFLAVNYIDRFLSTRKVVGKKLQLLGVSCMLVASKYEETSRPSVGDCCDMTDNEYTKDEVMHMEIEVLKALEYEMGNPTTKTFLRIFTCSHQEEDKKSRRRFEFLCDYIAELSLTDYYSCVGYVPSIVAASTIFLARFIMQPECHPWTPALQKHTGYEAFELKGCVLRLHNLLYTSEKSAPALQEKFLDLRFENVASMSPPFRIPGTFFKATTFMH